MKQDKFPRWYPDKPPIYDIHKTYLNNALDGPVFPDKVPVRELPPQAKWIDFFGFKIASPIGIPAGPLLSAKWIKLACELGYDVVTYKTIRSQQYPSHPLPNMVYVDTHGPVKSSNQNADQIENPPKNIEDLAVTNSFGMPSMTPEFLMEDISRANGYLKQGQVMIVSVVGTPRAHENFRDDFVKAAALAKTAGAKIIEANFSCPNVEKREGSLYMSPETVLEIGTALVKAVHPIPLILKMGLFLSKQQMRDVLVAAARTGTQGICGINSVSMQVSGKTGEPALGQNRLTSGICGGPIRAAALQFLTDATEIIRKEKLDFTLLGCGGITAPEHFDQFLAAGAAIAMTATGMIWDPYLAMRYHAQHG